MIEQPQLFGVIEHVEFPKTALAGFAYLANLRGGLRIVCFTVRNLADPVTEPIGLYYHNGYRRYIWQDKFWADFDVPCGPLEAAISIRLRNPDPDEQAWRKVLDILGRYRADTGSTLQDHIDNPSCQSRQIYRGLYEINE